MSSGSKGAPRGEVTRRQVRERYARIAASSGSPAPGCCDAAVSAPCCGESCTSVELGYTERELSAIPEGANLGLGCGNPTAIASLTTGLTVLDLGSGAGIDCFLASKKVETRGRVIGVDMTPEMLAKARENARKGGYRNVEFRLGEIEHLPVADGQVDVVISNCVINLVPDKRMVYREAFRVLRPGGRLAVSDVVATRRISAKDRRDPALWTSCSSGAQPVREVVRSLEAAGFTRVHVDLRDPGHVAESLKEQAGLGVLSADIRATKPGK